MYIPKHFEQHDAAVMKALTEANLLGAMVICDSELGRESYSLRVAGVILQTAPAWTCC